ncbi:hypothetical protein AVEN_62057-1 [Araneus ventricosus]|uniref:Uncharacterized protein n=1 Tax=Araneus ventricosus TaxID=182803 RepID=A0A4Y2I1N8_ARAVE|nr:hypothetical protein AVEN_62057-1 [Araneus ventricosus]
MTKNSKGVYCYKNCPVGVRRKQSNKQDNGETTLYFRIFRKDETQVRGKTQGLHKLATQANSKALIITRTIALSVYLTNSQCEQDTKDISVDQNTFLVYPYCHVFIVFLTGRDVTWKSLEKSGSRLL